VLFGKRRAYQRKVAVAEFEAVVSGDIYVLAPKDSQRLLPELLPFLCLSERFFQHAVGTSAGSLSPRTNWSSLASFEFDLPPLDQQRRIAEILWAVDDVKVRFEKTYADFLAAYETFGNERLVCVGHPLIKLGDLTTTGTLDIQTGPFGTVLQASSYVESGTPIVNPVNMVKHRLITNKGPFLDRSVCERLIRYRMEVGDILLGRKGDVGRAVLVNDEYAGYIVGSDLIRLRLTGETLEPEYLYYFLLAPHTRNWISRHASGTTMPGINEKLLKAIQIPIPPRHEQLKLVRSFEEMNSTEDALSENLSSISALILGLTNQLTVEKS